MVAVVKSERLWLHMWNYEFQMWNENFICESRVRNNGSWFVNHESIFIFHERNFIEIDQNHESKVSQIDKNIQ
jgi:hypothetical protein